MDAGASRSRIEGSPTSAALRVARTRPATTTAALLAVVAGTLALAYGVDELAQRTVNGVVAGSYFALGAVGLTLVYGTLKVASRPDEGTRVRLVVPLPRSGAPAAASLDPPSSYSRAREPSSRG